MSSNFRFILTKNTLTSPRCREINTIIRAPPPAVTLALLALGVGDVIGSRTIYKEVAALLFARHLLDPTLM